MYLGGLCFITERKISRLTSLEMTRIALISGIRWIQYREKEKTRLEIYDEALKLRKLTKKYGSVFIVNDHADIALAVGADGVHLGQDDLPLYHARKIMGKAKIVGISTHNIREALDAWHGGADYIGFGPVFRTATKDAGRPKGVSALGKVKDSIGIPVVAIGGIDKGNFASVLKAGADAVASASALLRGDMEGNIEHFLKILKTHRQ
jgi:thiamine-phosphate pyrophosphorylase